MATLQYVGARYVPKLFDDGHGGMEWQPNTYYEPLTIVTYNNSSYTSRGPVAASVGNPAENGEYWAMTGNFNAQLMKIQEQVNENTQWIHSATFDKNIKTLLVGDSYSFNIGTAQGWGTFLQDFINSYGLNVKILSKGGCGINSDGINVWSAFLSTVPDLSSYDRVIILGGANDANFTVENTLQEIGKLAVMSRNNSFKLEYGFIGHCIYRPLESKLYRSYLNQCNCFAISGISMISPAYGWLSNRSYFSTPPEDGKHPNDTGCLHLARMIMQYLMGESNQYIETNCINGLTTKTPTMPAVFNFESTNLTVGENVINIPYTNLPDFLMPGASNVFALTVSLKGSYHTAILYQLDDNLSFHVFLSHAIDNVSAIGVYFPPSMPYGII